MATPTLFDFLDGMMKGKKEFDFTNPEISSAYDIYIINRWLSMCDLFLPYVAAINKRDVPKSVHYEYFKSLLPQKKVYLTYIKKVKDLTHTQKVYLARHFKTNLKNVEPMISLLSEEELNKIINIEKEII